MQLKEEGQELLEAHEKLYTDLKEIPSSRELTFRVDIEENLRIGKPRFAKRYLQWPKELYGKLRDHLQDVWKFFDKYSHWVDSSLMALISYAKTMESKKSIIFLLEHDVWETNEVYGDYLIEKYEKHSKISHYRFSKKLLTFDLETVQDNSIEEWIRKDAIKQIEKQFNYLWSTIETEIKVCIEEKYHKEPKLLLSSHYLSEQLQKIKNIVEDWPEAALLNLGRICEMWVLIQLKKDSSGFGEDSLMLAERKNIISKDEFKFLKKIRRNYNDLKHKRYYSIDMSLITKFITDFSNFFKFE